MNLVTESLAEHGAIRAIENAEPSWRDRAMEALKAEAATGNTFESYTLETFYDVPPAENPNAWGGLFMAAKAAGIIRKVGYHPSERPGRGGGVCAVWVGSHADVA